ncbi:MAG: sulfotransferase family protein [Anaerolineae bacterium]|jgi:hypothetical protein|nr:sulfotransferase family protein [Anaerolineae bacterium]
MNMSERPLYFFLHIPKTGGSSFGVVLNRVYQPERIKVYQKQSNDENWEAIRHTLSQEALSYDMLQAHVPKFGIHEFSPRPMRYVTILRDPVARIISDYYYILRTTTHRRHDEFKRFGSLEDALPYVGANLQTRVISGSVARGTPVTAADLVIAKRNLEEHFAVVALLERFDESLILMRHLLGWSSLVMTPPHKNVATNRPSSVSDAELKLAAELNQYDQELYNFANNLMDRRIREVGLPYWRDRLIVQARRKFYSLRQAVKNALLR